MYSDCFVINLFLYIIGKTDIGPYINRLIYGYTVDNLYTEILYAAVQIEVTYDFHFLVHISEE